MYSDVAAATPTTEDFIATEIVKPKATKSDPKPMTTNDLLNSIIPPKSKRNYLSDRLRAQGPDRHPEKKKKKTPKRKVISAAEDSISQSQSNQKHVIHTLHQASLSTDLAAKKMKKKKQTKKSNGADLMFDMLAANFGGDSAKPPPQTESGWKGEEWNENWGKDGKFDSDYHSSLCRQSFQSLPHRSRKLLLMTRHGASHPINHHPYLTSDE